jgi:hypothetical protein
MFAALPEKRLFCFGLGYSARALAGGLAPGEWKVAGTAMTPEGTAALERDGFQAFLFDGAAPLAAGALDGATHILVSIPPNAKGDPVASLHGRDIAALKGLQWLGYLSSTGVYGDSGGRQVDESSALKPTCERSRRRVAAEAAWLKMAGTAGLPVHVFRLAGIYGPGRSVLDRVRNATARRIEKPGHLFGRVHVDDVAGVIKASMARPSPGAVYNVTDDLAAEAGAVTAFACELLGVAAPPITAFDDAAREMSAMALSFWRDDRLVANGKIKSELGVALRYPDYKAGLRAVLAAENGYTKEH